MRIPSEWLVVGAIVCVVAGLVIFWLQYVQRTGQRRHIDVLLAGQAQQAPVDAGGEKTAHWSDRLVHESSGWLNTKLGQNLVAEEDRALLVQCGYQTGQSRTYFLLIRIASSLCLPLMAIFFLSAFQSTSNKFLALFFAFAMGFLLPKWVLRRKAASRSRQAERELPVLVDLLGLLQGAGLGIDQSLQLISKDFRKVMPVLSGELEMANRLHSSGRTREQALQRMSEMFRSDALADLSALIVQIDKFGGAVQEPLRQFGARLREQRQMRMKEEIGKITVKMTGVMVLTLLPSLLIITAGPGFLSVIRALGGMK